jgi:hypothetical protein
MRDVVKKPNYSVSDTASKYLYFQVKDNAAWPRFVAGEWLMVEAEAYAGDSYDSLEFNGNGCYRIVFAKRRAISKLSIHLRAWRMLGAWLRWRSGPRYRIVGRMEQL